MSRGVEAILLLGQKLISKLQEDVDEDEIISVTLIATLLETASILPHRPSY